MGLIERAFKAAGRLRRARHLCIALLATSVIAVGAQARIASGPGPAPASFRTTGTGLSAIDAAVMTSVDEAQYLREDEERVRTGIDGPPRFAAPLATHLTTAIDGTWTQLPDGGRIWRCEVISVGARTLNFGFTTFHLPPGATVHLYPAGSREYLGPYTQEDATPDGQLWTPVVRGDDAVIELFVPAGSGFEPELVVGQVAHDYRGFAQVRAEMEKAGSCNNDVVCPEGAPWQNQINSEGVFTISGTWTCSGQMINSNNPTPPPYFLTANHCRIDATNAGSVVVYWNFQSPTCGEHGGGSLTQHQSGAILRANWSTSDFCLIQFLQNPPDSCHVFYTGWDARESAAPSASTCIHHPDCDEKSISFNLDSLEVTSYLQYTVPGDGTHWRVDNWEDGTTEPGSSGSGLWNPNHRLVGQLHGGYASCTSLTSDWFGRLSRSWTGGGASASRLQDWLDPAVVKTQVLDGRYYPSLSAAADGSAHIGPGLALSPNPTRGPFEVRFNLARGGMVSTEVFDAAGRMVASRPAQAFGAGSGSLSISPANRNGEVLSPGLYFVRVSVDGRRLDSRKLIVMQ
jgi:lysyl endopeptidase